MSRMETVRDQERWPLPKLIYAILMSILLISYLVIQAFDHEPFALPTTLVLPMTAAAVLGIWLGRLWRDKGFLLMIALLLFQIIRVAVKGGDLFFSDVVNESLINGLWVIGGCYALGRILSAKQLKSFIRTLVAVWTICITLQCLIALYGAWTDHEVLNLSGGSCWGIPYAYWQEYIAERLHVGYAYPTVAGSTLSLSGALAFGAVLAVRPKWAKVLYGLAFLVIIITLGLTDARASILSLSASVGVLVFSTVIWLTGRKDQKSAASVPKTRGKQFCRWLIAFVSMIVVFLISTMVILKAAPVFNEVKTKGSVCLSSASAEEAEGEWKRKVQSRGLNGMSALNGRDTVWREVINYCTESRKRLLFGESIADPMAGPNLRLQTPMSHCHNMIVQILLESGLTGLLLVICFGAYITIRAFRIIKSSIFPLWIKLLPAIPVSVLVGDLAECFGWFRQWKIPALAFMFVAFGIIDAYGDRKVNHQEEYLA